MVKIASSDILAILRKFNQAGDDNVPRQIEQLVFSHPNAINTLASFKFQQRKLYVLYDDTAEDQEGYIIEQLKTAKQDIEGALLKNPGDTLMTYGMPYKGKDVYLFEAVSSKKRLDAALAEQYPEYSRSTWQKYIKAGYVSINGTIYTSPNHAIMPNDQISTSLPEATNHNAHELPIVYMDDNVIVVNKPVGVLTHTKGALNDEFTVADFFRRYTTFGLDTNRPGIVHRLDRDTSGIIVGARNPETAHLLQKQFADRKTKKTYIAILNGHLKNDSARIELPIGRNPSAPSTFRVDPKGKPAITEYTVLATNEHQTLVALRPQTGRTHQLRVHAAYLNAPIAGDRVYGKEADRLYLHAFRLEITIPTSDRRIFEAPLPIEFSNKFPEVVIR